MSPEGAQLRFAVEFATFLVAVAGAAIVLLRPQLVGANRRSRVVLALGFAGVAAAAFLHGSILTGTREITVISLRGAGIVLLAIGTLGWGEARASRRALWISLVVLAVSLALSIVISRNVEREALRRVEARSLAESEEILVSSGKDATNSAK